MRITRRKRRLIAYAVLLAAGLLPWLTTFGMGLYLRSPLHRAALERDLSRFFELPTRVGRVVPLSWNERLIYDVEIFLPDASGQINEQNRIAYCRQARWINSDSPGKFDLELTDGTLDLTPARWARGDFTRLARSLRHDYPQLKLNRVRIGNSSVRWAHQRFAVELAEAGGEIAFERKDGRTEGFANLLASKLNGEPATVAVQAKLDPINGASACHGDLVREFTLSTDPNRPIPLRQFHLDDLFGGPVTSGQFVGHLNYNARVDGQRHVFNLRNSELTGLRLEEFTRAIPSGRVGGRLDLKIALMQIEEPAATGDKPATVPAPALAAAGPPAYPDFLLTRLRFSGTLSELELGPALAAIGLPACAGKMRLSVEEADLAPGPISRIRATGKVDNLDMAELSALLADRFGNGRIRGPASIDNFALLIEDGKLLTLDADLLGVTPTNPSAAKSTPPAVDFKLIEAVIPAVEWLNHLPVTLPESIPYRALAAHAIKDGDQLIVLGLGGSDKKSLMTLLVPTPGWTQSLGLANTKDIDVPAPGYDKPFDLSPLIRRIGQPFAPIPLVAVQQKIRERITAPHTQPDFLNRR